MVSSYICAGVCHSDQPGCDGSCCTLCERTKVIEKFVLSIGGLPDPPELRAALDATERQFAEAQRPLSGAEGQIRMTPPEP